MKRITIFTTCLVGVCSYAQTEKQKDSINKDTFVIEQVIIKAQHKKSFADKSVYTFDKDALEKARYAKDVLVSLPELQIDPESNTLQSIKGGKTLILINNIEATDLQIKSIKPQDVIRVEYFNIAPTRWANKANVVVNVITQNAENGYALGSEFGSAVTTGFVNGSAYANLTKGKNNFGVEYSIYFRDYNNRENNNSYQYKLNNHRYTSEEKRKIILVIQISL